MYLKPCQGLCLHFAFFLRDIDLVIVHNLKRTQEFKNCCVPEKNKRRILTNIAGVELT